MKTQSPTATTTTSPFGRGVRVRLTEGGGDLPIGAEATVIGWVTHSGYLVVRLSDGRRACVAPVTLALAGAPE